MITVEYVLTDVDYIEIEIGHNNGSKIERDEKFVESLLFTGLLIIIMFLLNEPARFLEFFLVIALSGLFTWIYYFTSKKRVKRRIDKRMKIYGFKTNSPKHIVTISEEHIVDEYDDNREVLMLKSFNYFLEYHHFILLYDSPITYKVISFKDVDELTKNAFMSILRRNLKEAN